MKYEIRQIVYGICLMYMAQAAVKATYNIHIHDKLICVLYIYVSVSIKNMLFFSYMYVLYALRQ